MTHHSPTFAETGFALIPSFLALRDVSALRAAVDKTLTAPRHAGMSRPGNDLLPLRWDDAIVARCLGSPRCMALLRSVLVPRDLKWLSAYVTSKAPLSPALWWHQDWWCWDHPVSYQKVAPQVAVLCYLTDTGVENGALRVLPGSHRTGGTLHRALPEPHSQAANGLPEDHAAMADHPGQVTLALHAGDAVVLDYRLLHGTHANRSAERRDCILLSFVPAWRDLPAEIRAHMIAHPALPDAGESGARRGCAYADLLPQFDGEPASLPVNRLPPADFAAHEGA
ncbi:phytanoyl-CoA dioxygenase family protein [Pseudorhodoplanes sinuspersici]|uniref:Phytanoyl-CoA dioxygenase n=1 Tax=Pseudorhodoplanes sinuspersici TaxID=1235591 RepID=A0A1W6ZRP9_9HYPH|nr:phytanoyl-CoA dioxygenase family protein [Pseudorhodoplanes sinuspersici]ARQ00064.1 phytanoyl-CoA dioxygenase [Pseudorhodoplanes sinuspersici]RKE71103.1 phytanoyl-CoA dioxygenase PhyH [Pseudorhodoplanes sinuspersici]